MSPATDISAFIAGFVAAEASFLVGGTRPSFTFTVQLGGADGATCYDLQAFLGVGHVRQYRRRRAHYDDEVRFSVRKLQDLVEVIVPFMDEHLPVSYKRQQYVAWRDTLLDYWEHKAKRRRACTVPGCEALQRGLGACRRHYYQLYRR